MTIIGKGCIVCVASLVTAIGCAWVQARQPDRVLDIWPNLAPGETTGDIGKALPTRATEIPPATRIAGITRPQLHFYASPSAKENTAAALIFPGGGYNYVVVDKEGSEIAEWLNGLDVHAFVVHYRTKLAGQAADAMWKRPVQDGQRAIRIVRQKASELKIAVDKIGVIGFSAGGNAAGLVATRFGQPDYQPLDDVDRLSCRPDFAMLIYPWQLANSAGDNLSELVTVGKNTPPTFLAHAHDDRVTPLSSVYFYAALQKNGVSGELHIYQNGGHGYGARPVANSEVASWTVRAADWLRLRCLSSSK